MKRTSRLILALLPIIVLPCIIGTGFAIFNLGGTASKTSNSVNISIEEGTTVGTAALVFHSLNDDGTDTDLVNEANNSSLSVKPETTLFCDTDSVYYVQNYRLYEERSFILSFKEADNWSDLVKQYTVSLNCTMTFEDSNTRGVNINTFASNDSTTSAFDGTLYPTTNSLLDVVNATKIDFENSTADSSKTYTHARKVGDTSTSGSNTADFTITNYNNGDIEKATYITYSAVVCDDLEALYTTSGDDLKNYPFKIKLEYKSYDENGKYVDTSSSTSSDTTYSFMPSNYRGGKKDGVSSPKQSVIRGIYTALNNSVIDIFFTLALTEKASS